MTVEVVYQGASTFSLSHVSLLTPEIINLIFFSYFDFIDVDEPLLH